MHQNNVAEDILGTFYVQNLGYSKLTTQHPISSADEISERLPTRGEYPRSILGAEGSQPAGTAHDPKKQPARIPQRFRAAKSWAAA